MDSEPDWLTEQQADFNEDLIVGELCDYQSRLDQGQAGKDAPPIDDEIPAEFQKAMKDYRGFLDFLHETRTQTDFPAQKSATSKNLAGYALPTRIGRFKIIDQLGFGGFGVVFRGLDPTMGREVAIKIPRPEFLEAPEFIDRFAREASIVAQLSHPNIVSVYESGCYEIVPYIIMPYLPGKTLPEWRAGEADVQPRIVATIVRELALAVAHAHERGVLHRDLKPGNVILAQCTSARPGDELDFVPMLTDFGMARCAEINSPHTRTGTMIGTSCYMSPEQAEGRSRDITARSDVYGLGTVLYELLTGAPPFQTTNEAQTLQKVLHDDPRSPRSIRPQVPVDLEMICLKCLEKSPANRYSTAEALADDLQRFLDGAPIRARPISRIARLKKWVHRYPTSAAVVAAGVFGVLMLIGISLWYNSRLIELLEIAETERVSARRNESYANRRAYDSDMRNAKFSLDRGNLRQMLKFLDRQKPKGKEYDFRDFTWWSLWREYDESSRLLGRHEAEATAVAVSRKGDLAASGGSDSIIRLWSIPTRKLIGELRGHQFGAVESVSFSPNGQRLASAGEDGTIRVWDLSTMHEVFIRRDHRSPVSDVVYSPRGNVIASAGGDKIIRLWNPNTGDPAGILNGHTQTILSLAFHPTEDILASGGADATIRLWDLCERCPDTRFNGGSYQLPKPNHWPRALVFEPNGKSLVAGIANAETCEFSLEEHNYGEILAQHSERANALSMIWPRNGSLIVALGDSEIRVADRFEPGWPGEWRRGHFRTVMSIAAPADGSFLVSAAQDGEIRFWPQFQNFSRIVAASDKGGAWEIDPRLYSVQWREEFLAADFQRGELSIYRMPDRRWERTIPKDNDDDFALSPSGRLLLVHERSGLTTCYQVNTGTVLWSKSFPPNPSRARSDSCAIDKSEEFAMITCEDELIIVSVENAEIVQRLGHPDKLNRVQFVERAGNRPAAISTCNDTLLRIWDVETGVLLKLHPVRSNLISSLAVSNDRRFIAIIIGGDNPVVNVWKLEDMALTGVVPITSQLGPGSLGFEINKVAFLTPSKIVVRSSSGFSLWDVQDEAELMAFPEYDRAGEFAISPDGQQIAVPQRGWIRLIDGRSQPTPPAQ